MTDTAPALINIYPAWTSSAVSDPFPYRVGVLVASTHITHSNLEISAQVGTSGNAKRLPAGLTALSLQVAMDIYIDVAPGGPSRAAIALPRSALQLSKGSNTS